jgi:peptidoglycan/xylan/chitin deacetylase (PgdA/CDA1 family)
MNKLILNYGKLISFLRLHRLMNNSYNNCVRVLYAHEVNQNDINNYKLIIEHVSKDNTYITPEQFFNTIENQNTFSNRNVLLTFDDGLLSSYEFAKNILSQYNIKAIFFIPTAVINLASNDEMKKFFQNNIYYNTINHMNLHSDRYMFMKKEHMVELSNDGHMICPHTHNHVAISDITNILDVKEELKKPNEIISEITSKDVKAFAFPVGTEKQVSAYSYSHIRDNYKYCFTALSGIVENSNNKYNIPRSYVPADASLNYVSMVMDGVYDLHNKYKMKKLLKRGINDLNSK